MSSEAHVGPWRTESAVSVLLNFALASVAPLLKGGSCDTEDNYEAGTILLSFMSLLG